ncbi:MAG TPA: hypothetical protein VLR29_01130, partial [Flavobacterium sp.]|nr:hypothetical protein [Flavobacterium sp.]
ILKDYNGQTYWFSANLHSFFSNESKIPKWLNVAFGYGADGLMGKNDDKNALIFPVKPQNYRQFYLSLDADLTKINTKSHLLKTIFSVLNTVKIPAPTFEYSPHGGFKFHALYF